MNERQKSLRDLRDMAHKVYTGFARIHLWPEDTAAGMLAEIGDAAWRLQDLYGDNDHLLKRLSPKVHLPARGIRSSGDCSIDLIEVPTAVWGAIELSMYCRSLVGEFNQDAAKSSAEHEADYEKLAQASLDEVNAILTRFDLPNEFAASKPEQIDVGHELIRRSQLVNRGKSVGLLGVSTSSLSQWIADKNFPRYKEKRGREEYFSRQEVNAWLKSQGRPEI